MMRHPDQPLYIQIADWIRNEISEGRIVAGQRLPPVRELTSIWNCTPGTIQRAYAELADQGLIISRPGQGTHVVGKLSAHSQASLRRIFLLHRSEAFLLESLTAGYRLDEIEASLGLALDRFRITQQEASLSEEGVLRFAGSHDFLLTWLASHFPDIIPRYRLQLGFTGSLGGLISLAEGKADFSGSHLWDPETNTYNTAYVRRLLPGKRTALLCLAYRRQGLILPPGNPARVSGLADLTQPGLLFINRQPGSGTRVWLDA
ncbi:MAG: GntR family transcriptional regulator, partial [Anaerolineales bacterium]|nr:GntR family transcriptional regulator [Anaerolineales bacterium]